METGHIKDEQRISIQIDMATVPASAVPCNCPTKAAPLWVKINFVKLAQRLGSLVLIAGLSFGAYYAISRYVLQSVEVVGSSMVPTLHEGNHYLLNRWALQKRQPQHRDVVVIRDPGDHGYSVKRIVAVEGESVYFKDGRVFVDGQQLKESYLLPGTYTFTYAKAHSEMITCGKGQYFVLGDNRTVSIDSRSYGPVSRQDILGVVMLN
jgi:signal peptidase I